MINFRPRSSVKFQSVEQREEASQQSDHVHLPGFCTQLRSSEIFLHLFRHFVDFIYQTLVLVKHPNA